MFCSMLVLTLHSDRKMEQSLYDDLVRNLMGQDSYLLFVFDKLISAVSVFNFFNFQTLKNMPIIWQVDENYSSLNLYKKFSEKESLSEHQYLQTFHLKLTQIQNFSGQVVRLLYSSKSRILCIHLLNFATNITQKTQTC